MQFIFTNSYLEIEYNSSDLSSFSQHIPPHLKETKNISIAQDYSDAKLRILVEEYITMQKHEFTFKSLCLDVLYRAMEKEKTANTGLY